MNQPEPMPHPGSQDVAPSLKQRFGDYIDQRTELGIKIYGTPLQTDNGRDPRVDMTQEILDFTQYQEQDRMELAVALTQARIENENLIATLHRANESMKRFAVIIHGLNQRIREFDSEHPENWFGQGIPGECRICEEYTDVLIEGTCSFPCLAELERRVEGLKNEDRS